MAVVDQLSENSLLSRIGSHLESAKPLRSFAQLLFSGADAHSLDQPTPEALAVVAREAFAFIGDRPAGRAKVRVRRLQLVAAGADAGTLLEIINDDMPFLVDSVIGELRTRGLSAHFVLHPILKARRAAGGALEEILGPGDHHWGDGSQESFIAIALDPLSETAAGDLAATLSTILDEVRVAVSDWQTMLARLDRTIAALEQSPPPVAAGLLAESLAFFRWLRDGQFTFLGLREFKLSGSAETGELVPVEASGLGVLRDPSIHVLSRRGEALAMTPEIRGFFFAPQPLILSKSNIVSRIHRRVHMDYIGIKTYAQGAIAGELRIVGLFTSAAYTQPPHQIPFLRHKVENVVARSGFAPGSHAGKALLNVLETFPRDELFQVGEQQLLDWARGIVDLELRPGVRVFARPDRFDRFVSVFVYIQRDRFSSTVRERIGGALAEAYNGRVTAFTPFFPEGPLVRVHFIIGRSEGARPEVDVDALEKNIAEVTRTWDDQLSSALRRAGPGLAPLAPKYERAFSVAYAETFSTARALEDIERIERLGPERPVAIDFYREDGAPNTRVRAAVYRFDKPIPLSERVPVLEAFGFSVIDERSYRICPKFTDGAREVALHDMVLDTAEGEPIDLKGLDQRMEDCFLAVFRGEADNDRFNGLVVTAAADWREAASLRAYAAYLRQIRSPFGPRYVAETLNRHAGLARDLIEWFRLRFDPDRGTIEARAEGEARLKARIEGALANVPSLDEDRILRHYVNLIAATVRTNFFQTGASGAAPATIAFKLASAEVDRLPEPKPFREIWVYSPSLEGIHLRFAPIARGGLRWSDRAQDFRTEVLGLCKAQQVKNTVIVPAGAKGGFVPKQLPRSGAREEVMKVGIAVYRTFVSAMLDITDNIKDGVVLPPPRVVRHEGDDPYLVVAADKGTATFSDFANDISAGHEFWLGDAFASGGSAGYDHKKMAITARGAWECVRRHFREMDVDIQTAPFRVIGVGDMSGDVFGNGMLLSPAIRLVAAFDHRDIFVDPEPDPAVGLAERKRLFELPRSSWQDYDKAKLSEGGGIFSRSSKSIRPSAEARRVLGIEAEAVTPAELMRAILKCEADLLWFGGIGTYVRATAETDEQAGDRANDAVRVTGAEVRAKVIGEGANLGLTQRGRIEFASRGGRINTDFIDNSAGVNSSDQEVNIKIAVGPAVADGRLTLAARNALLASMTDEVAAACLANNAQQSLAISLAERRSPRDLGYLARLMRSLERRGLLDRKLETLPDAKEIAARQSAATGLTRPELAVLLSHAKIALSADLLAGAVPDDPACEPLLVGYFPSELRERYLGDLRSHRLRREIVATWITNAMINRGGPAMAVRLADETGRRPGDIAYAYLAVRAIFALPELWRDIDALDGHIAGQLQLDLHARVQDLVLDQVAGFLRQGAGESLGSVIDRHRAGVEALSRALDGAATPQQHARLADGRARLEAANVPSALAQRIAALDLLSAAPAITRLAHDSKRLPEDAARAVLAASEYFRVDELRARIGALKITDYYDRLAVNGALGMLESAGRSLAREVLKSANGRAPDFAAWEAANGQHLSRAKSGLDEIASTGEVTVSRLTVAAALVHDLIGR